MPLRASDPGVVNPMRPLSLRFTPMQIRKLHALRRRTGLATTEIIRRAVDDYLKKEGA